MDHKIEKLLEQLTLEEKISLLAGADTWRTHAVERLGIPQLKVSDGPNGVRGEQRDTKAQSSASFPIGTAMGATWNTALVKEIGAALGVESKAKGAQVLLGPTLNTQRHPLAGRNFECFSEDPYLSSRMAVAYISGLQGEGVGACAKHYACNDQETDRFEISSEIDQRTMQEIYLPAFQAAVEEADTWTVMSAYNKVNGTYVSEHPQLLREILKGEWGFEGIVISDWYGTYSDNVPGGGVDLEMPGPARWMGEIALKQVQSGELDVAVIDDKVRRILRTMAKAGLLDNPDRPPEISQDLPAHRELIRTAGCEAIVLLKNEDDLLPIEPENIQSLAVIGQPAQSITFQGGGSSEVNPHYVIQPLDAIRENAASQDIKVAYAPGPNIQRMIPLLPAAELAAADGTPERLSVSFYGNPDLTGEPVKEILAGGSELAWFGETDPEFDPNAFSVRMTGSWTPTISGRHTFSLIGVGRARWWLDGEKLVDWWDDPRLEPAKDLDSVPDAWTQKVLEFDLEAGRTYSIKIEFASVPGGRWRTIRLGALPPQPVDPIGDAVKLAQGADAAIVFAGLTSQWETEGQDRVNMDLPEGQDQLIARVAKANPNTIVVLNAGSPLHMPWIESVNSTLQMWYLGQESGNAISDVLFGKADPGGRLPTTFPVDIKDNPAQGNFPGEDGKVHYQEGIFVGYRHYDQREIAPLFPFGHGLSYTRFAYDNLRLNGDQFQPGDEVEVKVDLTNTGSRTGQEVVQLYLGDRKSSLPRPPKELKRFQKVTLTPGNTETLTFTLREQDLAYYDESQEGWVVEPGEFEVLIGRSAGKIIHSKSFQWTEPK